MDHDYKAIIAAAIKTLGSGEKLAKHLHITPGAVSQLRNGHTKPSPDNLMAMLKLMGKIAAAVAAVITATLLPPTGDVSAAAPSEGIRSAFNTYYTLCEVIRAWFRRKIRHAHIIPSH
jgi:transcriptional regulator with XRE-family HTH domain